MGEVGYLHHHDAGVRAVEARGRSVVVGARVAGCIGEEDGLPAGTVAATLCDELQIAVESGESAWSPEGRRHLSLQGRFRVVTGSAHGSRHRPRRLHRRRPAAAATAERNTDRADQHEGREASPPSRVTQAGGVS
jgi:hypothetical protein